jgi:hypothetical protein
MTEPARNNVAHWYWSLEQDRQQLGWFERSLPPGQLALPFHRTRARKPWADESLADYYLNTKGLLSGEAPTPMSSGGA